MPSITIREFHPESGALMGNISVLDFGTSTAGTHSRVKVIDVVFGDVESVSNIKLGLISSGGVAVNSSPEDYDENNSTSSGKFGVESSSSFSSVKTATPLSRHFPGTNSDGSSDNSNNVSIGAKNTTTSNYIYLDIETGTNSNTTGNGAYKIYFDYS